VTVAADGGRDLLEAVRGRAEWRPWLAVLEAVTEATGDRAWRVAVPESPLTTETRAPLLSGATLTPDARLVRRWCRRLLETAAEAGGPAAALARTARAGDEALAELLESGLEQDGARLSALAVRLGVEPEALAAVGSVAAVPLLRACTERWRERVPAAWEHGYCPICGAWPTLAEARGLDRARRLRCGRCAADWPFAWLRCAYCGCDDHERVGSLVVVGSEGAEARHQRMSLETCGNCRGYLKSITTLGATPADEVALLDLATVDLDVAVLGQGYRRPAGAGARLGARVRPRAGGLLSGWRAAG
jgi:FdhE protein